MEPPETDSQSAATTGTAAKGKPKAATEDFSPVVGVHFSNFIIQ
jgi:hypothetical protein